jgi:hypothetical protein
MIGGHLRSEESMRDDRILSQPRWVLTSTFVLGVILISCRGVSAADAPANERDSIFTAARAAVAKNRTEKSALLGGNLDNNLFTDLPGDGAVLIGFELGVGTFLNDETVYAIRPIYRLPEGETSSHTFGLFADKQLPSKKVIKTRVVRRVRVLADPGYAVGGVTLRTGLNIDGMSVTFMRIKGKALDPKRSYASDWIGGRNGGREKSVSGDGAPVVGVFGNQDADHVYSLGLIFIPGGAPADTNPVNPAVKQPTDPPVKKPAEPADVPPTKPVEVAPPAPTPPEIEPDAPDADPPATEIRPAKNQPDAASGINWVVPAVVFGIVAIPIFVALFFCFGRKAPPPASRPRRMRPDEGDNSDLPYVEAADDSRRPWDYPQRLDLERQGKNGMASTSLVLGSIGLLAWCLPIAGLPLTITGLVMGVKGLKSYKQGAATAGIVLNIIGLGLSLINAALGAYIAVASQQGHLR